jgi:hypothetical protein
LAALDPDSDSDRDKTTPMQTLSRIRQRRHYAIGDHIGGLEVIDGPAKDSQIPAHLHRYRVRCLHCGAEHECGRVWLNERARKPVDHCKKCVPKTAPYRKAQARANASATVTVPGWGTLTKLGELGHRHG